MYIYIYIYSQYVSYRSSYIIDKPTLTTPPTSSLVYLIPKTKTERDGFQWIPNQNLDRQVIHVPKAGGMNRNV